MQKASLLAAKHFPDYGVSNVRWFYILSVLQNAWFFLGNWVLYVLLYMTTGTFAAYEAIAFGLGILIEIPSGAFADLFGRRKTVLIASFLQTFGMLLFTLGFMSKWLFFVGNLLTIVSFAFRSGAQEALVYDSMADKRKEEFYDDVSGKARSLMSLSIVVASVIGGIAWTIGVWVPSALTTVIFAVGFVLSFKYREPETKPEKVTVKSFIEQNRHGFYYLFKSDFRVYTFSFAIISGSFLMWHAGIIRPLMGRDFGYDGQTLSYMLAVMSFVGFLVAFYFRSIRKKLGDYKGFMLIMLVAAAAWTVTGLLTGSLLLGFLVFFGLTSSGVLSDVWTSVILNKHVHSKHRATAISTLAFLVQIPYVLVVVLFGQLVEKGNAAPFYIVTGILLFLGAVSFHRAERKKVKVTTSQ